MTTNSQLSGHIIQVTLEARRIATSYLLGLALWVLPKGDVTATRAFMRLFEAMAADSVDET